MNGNRIMARRRTVLGLALAAFSALPSMVAQQPVAPTNEQVGTPRGENIGDYNITNSFETGYRFSDVVGSLGKYRSDVNYRNGIRLLGSSLLVNSRDGHGWLFDQIQLTTLGLGNDPYQSSTLHVEKNGLYRYDMVWRLNEYYNPGLTVAGGEHLMDTRRRLQDHDLTLLPQSHYKFRVGYSRNSQDGPALSTQQLFDSSGDIFPLFQDIRRVRNEYRVGADVQIGGVKVTVLRRWEFFKEDTGYSLNNATAVGNTGLTQYSRAEPYHGASPGWLGNIYAERKRWAVNGRVTYVGGRRDFILDETAVGASRFGAVNRQVVVGGDASRPVTTGDLALSFFPTGRLTVVNNTSVHSTRIDGDAVYREFDNGTGGDATVNFRYLGILTVTNATTLNFRAAPWLGFVAGYRYSNRQIRLIEGFSFAGSPADRTPYEQENNLHAGTLGIRIKPVKPLTINLDGEVGRADHPLATMSDRNYHTIGARMEYRARRASFSTGYRQVYNVNPVAPLFTYSSHARNYSAAASWMPKDWFSVDATYTKLHLDTASGLSFFAGQPSQLVEGFPTVYRSNIHAATLGVRFAALKRVDFFAGYNITRDVGDGRATAVPPGTTDPVTALFASVQTFPLTFESPLARISLRLTPKLRWNVGWQFYGYSEQFQLFSAYQNYHANTGYTSLLWSF